MGRDRIEERQGRGTVGRTCAYRPKSRSINRQAFSLSS
ncbi:MAG: hypothetical protein AVDCRST_MAG64-1915 [uncultured Phycisphaerae bacterium]|uniref:Uncharacterized protein n=1 Tax=uncultured Phycisphaerae bacterium TaxID=904963 RepID=A0A6J4P2U3_9BACT|nr:MAG: hypothetical protein AVDCRST_MAG64-1915 [uncultured Phycisphaerae bacterium]